MNDITASAGTALQQSGITSGTFAAFIDYLDVSAKTLRTYRAALASFGAFLQENAITMPKRADVISWRESIKEIYAASTVQLYLTAIKMFFRFTSSNNLYPNVADNVRGLKISREHTKDHLTRSQVHKVMDTIADSKTDIQALRDRAMFMLMTSCGLRCIEVSRANVDDMRARGDATVVYVHGKMRDDKQDFEIIPPQVETALREYLNARNAKPGEPLFMCTGNRHGLGGRMSTRSISKTIKSAMDAAGLKSDRLTAHSTRHTAMTTACMQGESLQAVQQFARHANINTTMIYVHNIDRMNNDCSRRVADYLFS